MALLQYVFDFPVLHLGLAYHCNFLWRNRNGLSINPDWDTTVNPYTTLFYEDTHGQWRALGMLFTKDVRLGLTSPNGQMLPRPPLQPLLNPILIASPRKRLQALRHEAGRPRAWKNTRAEAKYSADRRAALSETKTPDIHEAAAVVTPVLPKGETTTSGTAVSTVICDDCFEWSTRSSPLGASLVLVDPPFGNSNHFWDTAVPDLQEFWSMVSKHGPTTNGFCVVFCNDTLLGRLLSHPLPTGWTYRHTLVWHKNHPTGHFQAADAPLRDVEFIFVAALGAPQYTPQKTRSGGFSRLVLQDFGVVPHLQALHPAQVCPNFLQLVIIVLRGLVKKKIMLRCGWSLLFFKLTPFLCAIRTVPWVF